jgi:gliding motility associated protien GldN
MINKKFFACASFLFLGIASYGQSNLLNAKVPSEIGKKTAAQDSLDNDNPLPYGYVGDRDVLFSKKVWETIDLTQRINFPLYFPVEDNGEAGNLGADRKSLFVVLVDAIKAGKLTEIYGDSYFVTKKTSAEIEGSFYVSEINSLGDGVYNKNSNLKKYKGWDEPKIIADLKATGKLTQEHFDTAQINPSDIVSYQIVGVWYFDKRQGEMKYRIMGLAPLAIDARTKLRGGGAEDGSGTAALPLFWVYYPAAREVLHRAKAFNEKNSATAITFDHLLNSRRFSSVIFKQANVFGDRSIEEYLSGKSQMQLLEAEKVKDNIRNFEQDMWNY